MNMKIYGTDRRLPAARARLRVLLPEDGAGEVILLPIPSVKDGVRVTGTDTDCLSLLGAGRILCGYGFPAPVVAFAAQTGAKICDVSTDETFLSDNARLTALGVFRYLLTHRKTAPDDWRVGIVGYGRIGKELLRMLLFHGAAVKVYTGKDNNRAELGRYGIPSAHIAPGVLPDFSGLSVLVNTAPAPLISPGSHPPKCLLDVASGKNVPDTVPHVTLPALPARNFPVSAGYAYGEAVFRALCAKKPSERSPE